MDAFLLRLDQLTEGLVTSTYRLLESSRSGNSFDMECRVQDRELLISELEHLLTKIDRDILSTQTKWLERLKLVEQYEGEIKGLLGFQLVVSHKELKNIETSRLSLLTEEQVDSKGNRLQTRG